MALAFVLPSIRFYERVPTTTILIVGAAMVFQVYKAADLQMRLGRPISRAFAAVLGVILAVAMVLVPFGIVSWLFGPRIENAPLIVAVDAIASQIGLLQFVVLFLGSLLLVVFIVDLRYGRARRRQRATERDAAIVREQAARARSMQSTMES